MGGGVLLFATLIKVTLLHGCFSRFLNCVHCTKSRNAPDICSKHQCESISKEHRVNNPKNNKRNRLGVYFKEYLVIHVVEIRNFECNVFEICFHNEREYLFFPYRFLRQPPRSTRLSDVVSRTPIFVVTVTGDFKLEQKICGRIILIPLTVFISAKLFHFT